MARSGGAADTRRRRYDGVIRDDGVNRILYIIAYVCSRYARIRAGCRITQAAFTRVPHYRDEIRRRATTAVRQGILAARSAHVHLPDSYDAFITRVSQLVRIKLGRSRLIVPGLNVIVPDIRMYVVLTLRN